jgi:hypothetical protein
VTDPAIAHTNPLNSDDAGATLGTLIASTFKGQRPHALILFAAPTYDYPTLLQALDRACGPKLMVGCSSSGEFSTHGNHDGSACAVALRSSEMQFAAGIGRGLRRDRATAAKALVSSFQGLTRHDYVFRSALVLTDALAGHADDLVEQLTRLTAGTYQFCGGGGGDDAQFRRTHVFCGTEAATDAVVALKILSNTPLGLGVDHAWQPASRPMRVTEAEGMRLASLNAVPAVEVFAEHAETTGQPFDTADPLPFFLHNIIGVDTGNGHKLRVPLAAHPDGSISCATEVPLGATTHIMGTTSRSAAEAAARATRAALAQLQRQQPAVALFCDCAATRLRMGKAFGLELRSLEDALGPVPYAGCNTFGQIARAEGQFSGFHNCTAVVCIIPG